MNDTQVNTQVVWLGESLTETTWESAADLPKEIVKEYEDGLCRVIQENLHTSGGQTVCTLSSTLKSMQPKAKKPHLDPINDLTKSCNSGYVTPCRN